MTRIIAITNQKGGTGKTTTAASLAAALSMEGRKVLIIDMDPQASLTLSLGIREPELTSYDMIMGPDPASSAIVTLASFDLIPAMEDLAGAELELAGTPGREFILREKLDSIASGYDYILIDCPPGLGLLTLNALTASTEVFIPLQAEYLAMEGLSRLIETVDLVRRRLNPKLAISGIILTRYDSRRRLNRDIIETVRNHFPGIVFDTPIRENISLAEAPGYGRHIFDYKADSAGAADYRSLATEIIAREGRS